MKIADVLMHRDGISREEADAIVDDAADELSEILDAGEIPSDDFCLERFGLEPDYIEELLYRFI